MKASIPTQSAWFRREFAHRNWLTMDSTHLDIALDTRTSVQPQYVPDRNWIEKELAGLLTELLTLIIDKNNWRESIELGDLILSTIGKISSKGQVDEALIFRGVLDKAFARSRTTRVRSGGRSGDTLRFDDAQRIEDAHYEIGRQMVDSLTIAGLGFASFAEKIDVGQTRGLWHNAVSSRHGPYQTGAVDRVLVDLEVITDGVQFELTSEREKVTPNWWIDHYLAHALSDHLTQGFRTLVNKIRDETLVMIDEAIANGEIFVATGLILAGLECVRKLEAAKPRIARTVSNLHEMRSEAIGDEEWLDLS
jgi:hypothetical protein